MVDIVSILARDYASFPTNQTYGIYAEAVYFKDPMNEFRGRDRYRQMIGFIQQWFQHPSLELHNIEQTGQDIRTDWTLSWTTPLPWRPRIRIPGWSEMRLNDENLIESHIDYWHCSRLDVLKQHFMF